MVSKFKAIIFWLDFLLGFGRKAKNGGSRRLIATTFNGGQNTGIPKMTTSSSHLRFPII